MAETIYLTKIDGSRMAVDSSTVIEVREIKSMKGIGCIVSTKNFKEFVTNSFDEIRAHRGHVEKHRSVQNLDS